jgi:beta-galactosidase
MKFKSFAALFFVGIIFNSCNLFAAETNSPREKLSLDLGWKFYLGNPWGDVCDLTKAGRNSGPADPNFSDATWRTVNLPHDWAVELPFDRNADRNHGYKTIGPGYPQNNIAWYRRSFEVTKADSGKRIWLDFDGVYRNCDVFVNDWFIGHHDSGYESFRYDITDVANYGGKNVVSVKVDASQFEGWFYEGAGIYRHVWLEKTAPVAIAPDGIFVYSKFKNNVPEGPAEIYIRTTVINSQPNSVNETNEIVAKVNYEIIGPDGRIVKLLDNHSPISAYVYGNKPREFGDNVRINSYQLWSPENPKLYKLITTVESDGKIVDRKETEFGIRTVAFDSNNGFLLNGKHYEIQGMCNHQDHAGVGSALPDALQYFRIAKLKEMGCNAYRTSHNSPTPEMLEACDRLGMLVLDENRLYGSDAANLQMLKEQILRDRNHPSVFLWSLGNEETQVQGTTAGAKVVQTMQNLAHSLDPSRECTAAVIGSFGDNGVFSILDVKGDNYNPEKMDAYHAAHPDATFIGTEQASTVCTRGIYTNDESRGYVSAYDDPGKRWGNPARDWWTYFDARPWLSGGFDWTGFDYRGEPTPYSWPCINSHFGVFDMCGFPKDNFYYYQSWWTTNIVLHLLPHWNWLGREGQEISVRALSNCGEVELFLNGESLGRKTMKKDSELKWNVKYAPGVLSAKGYNDGKLVAETKVETTGEPAAVQLEPDRATINADGEDASIITVSIRDAQNRIVPVSTNLIHFELSGPGKILGVGNGDPSSHEPDQFIEQPDARLLSINDGWRFKILPDVTNSNMAELQSDFDDSNWRRARPQSSAGTLKENESAIFRKKIQVDANDLAVEKVNLQIGCIDDQGWVYVNGKLVGESDDYSASPSFDIKPFLQFGENTIAIAVANHTGPGGLCKGVALEFKQKTEPPNWQRSVFNGLAQIIVQSSKESGEIKLTASADGLSPMTEAIQSKESFSVYDGMSEKN